MVNAHPKGKNEEHQKGQNEQGDHLRVAHVISSHRRNELCDAPVAFSRNLRPRSIRSFVRSRISRTIRRRPRKMCRPPNDNERIWRTTHKDRSISCTRRDRIVSTFRGSRACIRRSTYRDIWCTERGRRSTTRRRRSNAGDNPSNETFSSRDMKSKTTKDTRRTKNKPNRLCTIRTLWVHSSSPDARILFANTAKPSPNSLTVSHTLSINSAIRRSSVTGTRL